MEQIRIDCFDAKLMEFRETKWKKFLMKVHVSRKDKMIKHSWFTRSFNARVPFKLQKRTSYLKYIFAFFIPWRIIDMFINFTFIEKTKHYSYS